VSGKITPTEPLPAETNPDNWLIAEKSLVNEVMLRLAGTDAGVGVVPEDVEVPHAASAIDIAHAAATTVKDLSFCNSKALLDFVVARDE